METLAVVMATPTPYIVQEVMNVLNSPMASIKTIDGMAKLLNFTNLFNEVGGSGYKGEDKWVYDLEKNSPIYSRLHA